MSRVLLFVQTGDGRPKCCVRFRLDQFIGVNGLKMWAADRCEHFGADRWWLVECENAEAGRACIALWKASDGLRTKFNDDVFVDAGTVEVRGRILASGGKP